MRESMTFTKEESAEKRVLPTCAFMADVLKSGEYRKAFSQQFFGEGCVPELKNTLSIGSDSNGSYLVPDEYENRLIEALEEKNVIRKLASKFPLDTAEVRVPIVEHHGNAVWVPEGTAIAPSDEAFGMVRFTAHKLGALTLLSEELLEDSGFDLPEYLVQWFADRLGDAEESAFLYGNGIHKPRGILNDQYGAAVGVTSASPYTFTADDLIDLEHSVPAPYRKNAAFLMHDVYQSILCKMKDGYGRPCWKQKEGTLLGHPIYFSKAMPEPGAGNKPVIFGDFSAYWIADRSNHAMKRLNEKYADHGQIGFQIHKRLDGALVIKQAMKVLKLKTE